MNTQIFKSTASAVFADAI